MRGSSLVVTILSAAIVAVLGGTASAAGNGNKNAPAYTFTLTFKAAQGQPVEAFFKSVSGLSMETEVVEFREGGANDTTHKLPGAVKWKNIVLKRGFAGVSANDPVQKWARDVLAGTDVRKDVTVVIRDRDQNEIGHFDFVRCFPVRWEVGPLFSPRDPASSPRDPASLDAPEGEMALETIEIAHEGMKVP